MENRFLKQVQKKEKLVCSLLLAMPLLYVALRFLLSDFNNASKSYLLADFYRFHLWPWLSGWNPHGYGGFPAGYFRPCLMEWLSGGLGKIIGARLALKFLACLSVAGLPLSIFLFLLDFEFSLSAIFISIFLGLTSLALFSKAEYLDYTFVGSFAFQKVTSFWSLPFIFLYLWAFRRGVRNFTYLCLGSVFFSVVVMSHEVSAKSLIILSLLGGYYFFVRKNRHKIVDYFIHLILTLILSLAWLGPYFLQKEFYQERALPVHGLFEFLSGWGLILLAVAGACGAAAYHYKKTWPEPLRFIVFLLGGLIADYFLSGLITWLPSYQIIPLIFIFGSFIAGYYLDSLPKRRVILFCTGALFLVATTVVIHHAMSLRNRMILNLHVGTSRARGLVDDDPASSFLSKMRAPELLTSAYLSQGFDILNGEETNSSIVAPYIYGFLRELDKDADAQGTIPVLPNPSQAYAHSLILGPQWVLTNELLHKSAVPFVAAKRAEPYATVNGFKSLKLTYWVYFLTNAPVMFLPKAPIPHSKWEWSSAVNDWWESKDLSFVPILTDTAPASNAPPGRKETLILKPVSPESYILRIGSPKPRWVFIKIPYFPDWKAFQSGQPIPLYRAGPNMMAVFTKGDVNLYYVRQGAERLFHYLSLGAWMLTLFFLAFQFVLHGAEKRPAAAPSSPPQERQQ